MLENLLGVTQVVVVLGPHSGAVAERTQTQAEGYKQRKLEAVSYTHLRAHET